MATKKELEKQKYEKYAQLGDYIYFLYRTNGLGDLAEDETIRAAVLALQTIDKDIADTKPKLYPSKDEKKCPACEKDYSDDATFCDNCGLNISEFYQTKITTCTICESNFDSACRYCPICGTKKGE